ncbi:MAG TPA: protein kinase [Gemmatimonadaceae bacterium]
MSSPVAQLSTTVSDRYRVSRELGVGGMATVYLAHDLKHGRDVALKVLHADLAASLGRERFLREIQLAARLSHPHILALYDSGEADGILYYVMPVVRGESLRDRLTRDTRLPVAEAVRIVTDAARALAHAHEQGIVHRDVKPENILLQDGHVLVADFGIGKAMGDIGGEAMTQAGMAVGTPAYISPEAAAGEPIDGSSDQYSLACVLYELLVGEPPFTGPNMQAVIAKRFVQTPADVTALRDAVPRNVARALHQALGRAAIDRFPTIAAFADALLSTDAVPAAAGPPPRSIAVLPFVNLSTDRDNDYLGDGIAEDIINALASIEGLQVAARASAFSFKGKNAEPREIGERLRVSTVLEGSIRRSGSRIRITAQLMAVADGYQLWSERYDREMVDVFAVQDEIASAIAKRLQLTFAAPSSRAAPASTDEIQAYELLVRAKGFISQRGRTILDAIAVLDRALELAPNDPNLHAAMGNAWRVKEQYALGTRSDCLPRAYDHLNRALALDPNHAEALGYLAAIISSKEDFRRHRESVALFERAMALNPRLSETRGLLGGWGMAVALKGDRDDERAIREVHRSIADDPLNPICSTVFTIVMGIVGHTAEAVEEGIKACEREPNAFAPHYALAWAHTWARNTDAGLAHTQSAMERFGRHPWLLQAMTGLFMQRGDRRKAEAIHVEMEARAITSNVQHFSRAVSAIYLGRIDEAFERALESAHARDGIGHMWIRFPDIEPILEHPRYPEILTALGA